MTDTVSTVEMRQRLLDAALEVIRRDGAAALTVRSVTAEAGCSTTGVYTYFGGKHGLVEAIFVDGFEAFDRATQPLLEAGDLVAACRAYRRWALDNKTQYLVMFGGVVPDYAPSDAARWRALESFFGLARAVERHDPSGDPGERAYRVFATQHGLVMLELAGMSAATEDEAAGLYDRAMFEVARLEQ